MENTYTITRLENWTDEQWDTIVDAIEETVVLVADEFEDID